MSRRIAVFGASGWIGRSVVEVLAQRGADVLGPSHAALDVADGAGLASWLATARVEGIVHLAAAQPGASPAALQRTNVVGARAVARAAAQAGLRLVHVSSDVVFDGRHAPYDEDAARRPVGSYGASKAAGEAAVLEAHPQAICVRTSLSWDPAGMDRSTRGFAERLARGEPLHLFTDEIRCPLPRGVLAEALVDLLDLPVAGPLHVAGREALSRHAFGVLLLEHFGVPGRERLLASRAADLEARGGPLRPRDLRLQVGRAERLLGRALPGVRDVLEGAGPRS